MNIVTAGIYDEVIASKQWWNGEITDNEYSERMALGALANLGGAYALKGTATGNAKLSVFKPIESSRSLGRAIGTDLKAAGTSLVETAKALAEDERGTVPLDGQPLPPRNPFLEGETPTPGVRGTGVDRAIRLEVELVQRTGKGTIAWTAEEIAFIVKEGRLPPGTVGHHINNVAQYPEWAGDPRNVGFVRGQSGNLAEHGGNFQNPTSGPLIDRAGMIPPPGQ